MIRKIILGFLVFFAGSFLLALINYFGIPFGFIPAYLFMLGFLWVFSKAIGWNSIGWNLFGRKDKKQ